MAYDMTEYRMFYDRAANAILQMMDTYEFGWYWTEYISEEQAHMFLPLSWLIKTSTRAEDQLLRKRAVSFLRRLAGDYLSHQQPCGAVQEWLGEPVRCARFFGLFVL